MWPLSIAATVWAIIGAFVGIASGTVAILKYACNGTIFGCYLIMSAGVGAIVAPVTVR